MAKPQGNENEKPNRPPLFRDKSPRHLSAPLPPSLLSAGCGAVRFSLGSDLASPARPMDPASEGLERRSRYLSALVRRTKLADPSEPEPDAEQEPKPAEPSGGEGKGGKAEAEAKGRTKVKAKGEGEAEERKVVVQVRAADMPLPLQRRAVRVAVEAVAAMPRLESKRLALALKKEFDTTYGPAWHCIVGTSFGSYVTHSLGGFLYFSVDKVYVLLFRTAVEPLSYLR